MRVETIVLLIVILHELVNIVGVAGDVLRVFVDLLLVQFDLLLVLFNVVLVHTDILFVRVETIVLLIVILHELMNIVGVASDRRIQSPNVRVYLIGSGGFICAANDSQLSVGIRKINRLCGECDCAKNSGNKERFLKGLIHFSIFPGKNSKLSKN